MCAIDDGERYDFYRNAMRKARKARPCSECGREIQAGESYECAEGMYDSTWYRHATCSHCIAARLWLKVECGGWLHEGVLEDLEAHWGEGSSYTSVWLGRAIVGLRKQWKRRDGALMEALPAYEAEGRGE